MGCVMEQNFVFDPCFNSSLFIINFSLFFQKISIFTFPSSMFRMWTS